MQNTASSSKYEVIFEETTPSSSSAAAAVSPSSSPAAVAAEETILSPGDGTTTAEGATGIGDDDDSPTHNRRGHDEQERKEKRRRDSVAHRADLAEHARTVQLAEDVQAKYKSEWKVHLFSVLLELVDFVMDSEAYVSFWLDAETNKEVAFNVSNSSDTLSGNDVPLEQQWWFSALYSVSRAAAR